MLRLEPLQQRHKRQNVHKRMEEPQMYKRVGIKPVHLENTTILLAALLT